MTSLARSLATQCTARPSVRPAGSCLLPACATPCCRRRILAARAAGGTSGFSCSRPAQTASPFSDYLRRHHLVSSYFHRQQADSRQRLRLCLTQLQSLILDSPVLQTCPSRGHRQQRHYSCSFYPREGWSRLSVSSFKSSRQPTYLTIHWLGMLHLILSTRCRF